MFKISPKNLIYHCLSVALVYGALKYLLIRDLSGNRQINNKFAIVYRLT